MLAVTTPTSDRTELLKRGLLLALSIVNWFALLSFTEGPARALPKVIHGAHVRGFGETQLLGMHGIDPLVNN